VIVLTGPPSEWEVGADTAVTIGVFDGVHIGHRRVIADLVALARSAGLDAGILTFDPHPLSILAPDRAPLMLTSIDQRVDQFRQLGVRITGVLNFPDIRQMPADEFCEAVIHRALRARHVVVGADFRFGRDRGGDVDLLATEGERLDFVVSVVDMFGDLDGVVSSTRIRQLIGDGMVEEAAALLGRPYELAGRVVEGDKRGRTIGFPTANIAVPPDRQIPGRGVYAGWATSGDGTFPAAINVGSRPTFDGLGTTIEAHLLDYSGDLYGEFLALSFNVRLREEVRFDGVEALTEQIRTDVGRVREVLN
jgi:riboflavin kinase / FMN adenylyltransferase